MSCFSNVKERLVTRKRRQRSSDSTDLYKLRETLPYYRRGTNPRPAKLHPDWINIANLRRWIDICDKQHKVKCRPQPDLTGRPQWLIDVQECCVVAARPEHRYVALSYVWGQAPSSDMTKDNIQELQRPGSLSPLNKALVIPKTIKHVLGLVPQLSERYVWIDRFCICQDDPESKHGQISIMGDIYANAYVTIIAANGWDADHGLRGIEGVTEPRQISPNFEHDYMESLQPYSSIWYDRGWTFQELVFSKRKIFFQYQVAVWECPCALWHEATNLSAILQTSNRGSGWRSIFNVLDSMSSLKPVDIESMSPWGFPALPDVPDLLLYFRIVKHYNSRKLTFPEDGYRAFSGVVSALEPVFPGGFIWGLPVMHFEEALLWVPLQETKRRVAKKSTEFLPSWSWVGWEGPVTSIQGPKEDFGNSTHKRPPTLEIMETVCQWKWPCSNLHSQSHLQLETETAILPLTDFFYWLDGEATFVANGGGYMLSPKSKDEKYELLLVKRSFEWYICLIFRREGELAYRMGVAMVPNQDWMDTETKKETIYIA